MNSHTVNDFTENIHHKRNGFRAVNFGDSNLESLKIEQTSLGVSLGLRWGFHQNCGKLPSFEITYFGDPQNYGEPDNQRTTEVNLWFSLSKCALGMIVMAFPISHEKKEKVNDTPTFSLLVREIFRS